MIYHSCDAKVKAKAKVFITLWDRFFLVFPLHPNSSSSIFFDLDQVVHFFK
jgi:hypothetical protein